jgi:hypothetical protein
VVGARDVPHLKPLTFFATLDGTPDYDDVRARADGFDAIWKRYMKKTKERAAMEGWTFEHFTEHDIRAKTGTDAEEAGQAGHKLLGNSEKQFRTADDGGIDKVLPLSRKS